MDSLSYKYNGGTNQLDHVRDNVAASDYTPPAYADLDDQAPGNYGYDEIGNLIRDDAEGVTGIEWNVYGKITHISFSSTTVGESKNVYFYYDAAGNRVGKRNEKNSATGVTTDYVWQVRDASGNVMAIYSTQASSGYNIPTSLSLKERHLYGSSRLGISFLKKDAKTLPSFTQTTPYKLSWIRGNKSYELTNHLGNVLSTVSDIKFGVDTDSNGVIDYYTADVVGARDYLPFGNTMPARSTGVSYRYEFNGKEKDREGPVQFDYGFRIYDPRLGRFKSVDPLQKKHHGESPYMFVGGNPLVFADPDGRDRIIKTTTVYEFGNGNSISVTSTKVIKDDFIKLQVRNQNGSIHYQYYDTRVETTNYINARTGQSTGGNTYAPPSTLSFISDYDIGTLSGKIGRAWEVLKNKFNNLVSEQHEGTQQGGGIMFTSKTGEGTNRGPKRGFVDASPESVDLLVATIGQLKSTLEAQDRAEDILEAIERMIPGSIEAGSNAANLIEIMKGDATANTKLKPVTKIVLAPARGVIRDPKTKQLRAYDVSTVESVPSNNSNAPDTIRTTKYEKPKE